MTTAEQITEYTIDENGGISKNQPQKWTVLFDDNTRKSIAFLIRSQMDDSVKDAIATAIESIIAEIIEAEVADVLAPRFEAMYEGVVASVIQKLLLKALTTRAQSTISQLTDPRG